MNSSTTLNDQSLSFHLRKSLLKSHIRRNFPWPIKTKLSKPIFILGSSRSGTTMLTETLASLPEVCDFTEKPIVRHQMWRMVEDDSRISSELPELEKSLVRLSGVKSTQRLLEKTPGHSLVATSLAKYFNDAAFIHILRDGRNVADSMLNHKWISRELKGEVATFWLHLLPESIQRKWPILSSWERGLIRWALYVNCASKAKTHTQKYLEVSYEDTCSSPKEIMYQVISFLNISPSPSFDTQIQKIRPLKLNRNVEDIYTAQQNEFYKMVISEFNLGSSFS